MIEVYVTLILAGKRTLATVPATLKAGVQQMLEDLGIAELLSE